MKTVHGIQWDDRYSPLEIELKMIASGAQKSGRDPYEHFLLARKLAWPDRYEHSWTRLLYRNFVDNDITIMMGAASTQKTSHASEFVLLNYWARPDFTLGIVSTTRVDKLETGIFGEIKMLFKKARELHPWLDGHVIDHKHCIATHSLDFNEIRDLRCGIMGRPCYVGHEWVGLGVYAGLKQAYVFFVADEIPFMEPTFLKVWPNMFSNGTVKIIGSGNPAHNPDDCLGIAAEPKDGWASVGEPEQTMVWPTRFMNAKCINLVGTDSDNFKVKEGQPEPYPKLIGPKYAARIAHDYGMDSFEYYAQVRGIMKFSAAFDRVLTRELCRTKKASESLVWKGGGLTRVIGLDPSYGGGDRCTAVVLEFGKAMDGNFQKEMIRVAAWRNYKFNLKANERVENQIAKQLEDDCKNYNVPVMNAFYGAFGKGTLGAAFGDHFKEQRPIPVDEQQPPTNRPVRADLFIVESNGRKRHKTCKEHYDRFISEMWFGIRETVEAGQMRDLPEEFILEACKRQYTKKEKTKVETKDDLKDRTGKSPDLADALAIGIEGARQRGFQISRLGIDTGDADEGLGWLADRISQHDKLLKSKQLTH
jgi:hypothetical protein